MPSTPPPTASNGARTSSPADPPPTAPPQSKGATAVTPSAWIDGETKALSTRLVQESLAAVAGAFNAPTVSHFKAQTVTYSVIPGVVAQANRLGCMSDAQAPLHATLRDVELATDAVTRASKANFSKIPGRVAAAAARVRETERLVAAAASASSVATASVVTNVSSSEQQELLVEDVPIPVVETLPDEFFATTVPVPAAAAASHSDPAVGVAVADGGATRSSPSVIPEKPERHATSEGPLAVSEAPVGNDAASASPSSAAAEHAEGDTGRALPETPVETATVTDKTETPLEAAERVPTGDGTAAMSQAEASPDTQSKKGRKRR